MGSHAAVITAALSIWLLRHKHHILSRPCCRLSNSRAESKTYMRTDPTICNQQSPDTLAVFYTWPHPSVIIRVFDAFAPFVVLEATGISDLHILRPPRRMTFVFVDLKLRLPFRSDN
ncbi:hypothetical protein B0H13DRAFT_2360095 [Mycena leptocephala]|nr:hypothetical protein B0H13DRAFT_2360095 [Mycena leptocephala]